MVKYQKSLLLLFLLTVLSCSTLDDKYEKVVKLDCGVYLKIVKWGLTGDNSSTYISTNSNLNDTIDEPYFRSLEFFYKVENCHLVIYNTEKLKRANLLNSEIILDQRLTHEVNFKNFDSLGYKNIAYQ